MKERANFSALLRIDVAECSFTDPLMMELCGCGADAGWCYASPSSCAGAGKNQVDDMAESLAAAGISGHAECLGQRDRAFANSSSRPNIGINGISRSSGGFIENYQHVTQGNAKAFCKVARQSDIRDGSCIKVPLRIGLVFDVALFQ